MLCKANRQGFKAWEPQEALLASGELRPVKHLGLRVS